MKIDGHQVETGDKLFDVVRGNWATVGEVPLNSKIIYIKNGMHTAQVREDGYVGNRKRYYWHNPIVVVPGKDDGERMKRITKVAQEIR